MDVVIKTGFPSIGVGDSIEATDVSSNINSGRISQICCQAYVCNQGAAYILAINKDFCCLIWIIITKYNNNNNGIFLLY